MVLIPLGHWFGTAGVGVAYLVAVAITTAGPLGAAWRRYEMPWAGPTVRSFAVVLTALIVAEIADSLRESGLAWILVDVIAALAVAVGGSLLLRGEIGRVLAARHDA